MEEWEEGAKGKERQSAEAWLKVKYLVKEKEGLSHGGGGPGEEEKGRRFDSL